LHATVYVYLHPESFDRLNAIYDHPKLSKHVRTISYYPPRFPKYESVELFQNECVEAFSERNYELNEKGIANGLQMSDEDWLDYYKNYNSYYESQQALIRGARLQRFLSRVFAKLPKLDSVDYCDKHYMQPPHILKGMLKTLLGADLWGFSFGPRDIKSVLSAASDADVRLKNAWLSDVSKAFFRPAHTNTPKLQSVFINLQSLRLVHAARVEELDDHAINAFQGLMGHCQQLQHLHVGGDCRSVMTFDVIGLVLPWKHLQSLKLGKIELDESKVVNFRQRQPTLSWFEASGCSLKSGTWESLSKRLEPYSSSIDVGSDWYATSSSKPWPRYFTPF